MIHPVNRRAFLRQLAILPALSSLAVGCRGLARGSTGRIMTVNGPIAPTDLGVTLCHEHVLVDFIGADGITRDRYDGEEAFGRIQPHLQQVRDLGVRSFVDCTPAYLGRNPILLQRLSRATGLHLLTNTGYYGARQNKFLPRHALDASADELANLWLAEWTHGLDGTNVRPGFIKIGVDGPTLSGTHQRLVRAAARTHAASGLTIASHTGPAQPALQQLDLLAAEGVSGDAFIWVHAQAEKEKPRFLEVARRGAWISLDGFGSADTDRYVDLLRWFQEEGHLHQILLSHDAGWFQPGESEGGKYRPHDALFTSLWPALRRAGFGDAEFDQLMVHNPRTALTIRRRLDIVQSHA